MEKHMKFAEYLNAKGKTVEQPVVDAKADRLEKEPKATSSAQAKTKKIMKKHDQVKEFVDAKGKLIEKPATEIVADYKGPVANAPKDGKPYKNNGGMVAQPKEKGFADEGPKDLIYNPETEPGDSKNLPGGKNIKNFFDETKHMTMKEFTQHMKGKIGFDAIKSVKDLVKLSESNEHLFFNLIFEVKRNGKLENLLEALLSIPETYKVIAKLVKEDLTESRVKFLYNAINEAVAPPVGMDDVDDGEESDSDHSEDDDDMNMPHDDSEGEEGGDDDEMNHDSDENDDMDHEDDMGKDGEEMDHEDDMGGDMSQSPKPFPSFKQKYGM
jgi:hypothetical protein